MTTGDAPTGHPCPVGGTTIGVVGGGTVGRATARAWLEHAREVRVYDVLPQRRTHPLPEVLACDVVFVCLPTPARDGRLDMGVLRDFFGGVRGSRTTFALRSTVPVGTTVALAVQYDLPNLCHHPEWLTARCALTDAQVPARNVIGEARRGGRCALEAALRHRFPSVPLHVMSSGESEAAKLMTNAFFAVKVAFMNEARALCDGWELDWSAVLAAVLADGRISPSHTLVPGPDGRRGFGGACLEKDAAQFAADLEDADDVATVTRAALARNDHDRGRPA